MASYHFQSRRSIFISMHFILSETAAYQARSTSLLFIFTNPWPNWQLTPLFRSNVKVSLRSLRFFQHGTLDVGMHMSLQILLFSATCLHSGPVFSSSTHAISLEIGREVVSFPANTTRWHTMSTDSWKNKQCARLVDFNFFRGHLHFTHLREFSCHYDHAPITLCFIALFIPLAHFVPSVTIVSHPYYFQHSVIFTTVARQPSLPFDVRSPTDDCGAYLLLAPDYRRFQS